jgi:hypothetical protein
MIKQMEEIEQKHKIEILKLENEIKQLKLSIEFKDEKLHIKEEHYRELEKNNKEKLSLVTKSKNKSQTIFNIQFNQILEKTVVFDDDYTRDKIDRMMHYLKIVNTPDNKVDQNFAREFANAIKDLAICTDQARGTLYIKDKNGKAVKINANTLVAEIIKIAKKELTRLCSAGLDYLRGLYDMDELIHEDYAERSEKLLIIQDHIRR